MPADQKHRIAIDCRITDSQQGIGTAVLALANALSESAIADQEYTFVIREDMRDWLAPHLFGPCRLAAIPASRLSGAKAAMRWAAPLRPLWRRLRSRLAPVPVSDGFVESQRFDLVHFPTQVAYITSLPSIYQPWDLQHLHYPDFFSKTDYANRERQYRAFCAQAANVCVQAEWTRQDVIRHYDLSPDKVSVIHWGSVFDAYRSPSDEVRAATIHKYALPEQFFFYPAVTWPHKNHEIIIRALHQLKTRLGKTPDVFFTGATTDFRSMLDGSARELGVSAQLHYLGFVTADELQTIYHMATAMVFPSKFEGFGLPILEAFHSRLPVLCSSATTLPEIAGGAALFFDPDKPDDLSTLLDKVLGDASLRQSMIEKGSKTLAQYSIKRTAAEFQALYHQLITKQKMVESQTAAAMQNGEL